MLLNETLRKGQTEVITVPIELQMLGWSVVLGLVHVLLAVAMATRQRGLAWNAGNRDGEQFPLVGATARAGRANHNFLETFPFFAAVALAVVVAGKASPHTALGAEVYFWARCAYLPIYIVGIPYLRTLVWAISLWGMLQLIVALF
jgi:uncharacterized MAPEG superfamily protein